MTLNYTISEKDYINFNKYHMKHSLYINILHIFACIIAPFYLCFTSLKESDLKEEGFPFYIVVVIMSLIIGLAFYLMMKALTWIGIKAQLKSGKHNDFIGDTTISLYDDFIEDSNANITSHIKYSSIEKICFGYNCLYIYIGAIKAIIVPVSAFTDNEQKQNFLDLLKQKTSPDILKSLKGDRRSK